MEEIILKSALDAIAGKDKRAIAKLALIQNLLEALHKRDILYCHWKSNEHLGASMTGDTDLDMLFDAREKERAYQLFQELGFKKFDAIPEKRYRDIEDFIGLDLPAGKIVHLHVHFKLTMGEMYLKGYQLNIESKILESRVFDKEHAIFRSSPAFELILLFFRESLKLRHRDILKLSLGKGQRYPANILREFHWLKQRCTNHDIEVALHQIVKNHQAMYPLLTGDFTKKQVCLLSALVKKEFKDYRLFSTVGALVARWHREVLLNYNRRRHRFSTTPFAAKRVHPHQGLVVAVIGADGSGKSTVISILEKTFGKKLDVFKIYFGKGRAGGLSWPRRTLVNFKKKLTQKKGAKTTVKAPGDGIASVKSFKQQLFYSIEALIVAFEKRNKLKNMHKARAKGMLVICDRFPQNQIAGFNDGPALQGYLSATNPVIRWMARKETSMYKRFESNTPDIVFKLIADAETIQSRKIVTARLEVLEAKVEGIRRLQFAGQCRVEAIDATQPLEDILSRVKGEIWRSYSC
jgi:thymidylate kinase